MRLLRYLAVAALPSLAALGCSSPQNTASLQDNFATDVFASFFGNANGLSTPYVEGSRFTITVQPSGKNTGAGWTLQSSNPAVMQIGVQPPSGSNEWPVVATGAGQATLTVVDGSGKVLDSEDVDVQIPTEVQLCAHGLLLAGYSDDQSAESSVRIVSGGTATFLARYYSGTQELSGNNAVIPTASGIATAAVVPANFSVRDFVEVSAADMGSGNVSLAVGMTTNQVAVEAVDPSSVASVALAPQSDDKAQKGETLYVFGRALDSQGNDLFGASFSWAVNGTTLPSQQLIVGGPTDLLTYQYDSKQSETISDTLAGQSASTQVHGNPSTTQEASTENVGCSVARGAGASGGAAGAAMLALGVAFLTHRRRRHDRRPLPLRAG
jgi:hypothetical protein